MEAETEMLRREICAGFKQLNARIDGLRLKMEADERNNQLRRETTERIEASRRESQDRIDASRKEADKFLVTRADIMELRGEIIARVEAINERIDRLVMRPQ